MRVISGLVIYVLLLGWAVAGFAQEQIFPGGYFDTSSVEGADWTSLNTADVFASRQAFQSTVSIFGGWNYPDPHDNFGRYNYPRTLLENGSAAGMSIGRKFGPRLRSEFEISWRQSGAYSAYSFAHPHADYLTPYWNGSQNEGKLYTYAGMINFLFDFDRASDRLLTPYGGVGLGIAYLDTDLAPGGVGRTLSNETTLAYQAVGGVSLKLTYRVDFYTEYRYFVTSSAEFRQPTSTIGTATFPGRNFVHSMQTHNPFMGLRFFF